MYFIKNKKYLIFNSLTLLKLLKFGFVKYLIINIMIINKNYIIIF